MRKDNKQLHMMLKALANPIRLDILEYLKSGEKCVCNIFAHLNLSQNLISHHLGILRENELINAKKDGKWVYYSLNKAHFVKLEKFMSRLTKVKNINKSSHCETYDKKT